MADLLPCPFCGGEAEVHIDLTQCSKCGALGPVPKEWLRGKPTAECWNRRQPWLAPEDVETLRVLARGLAGVLLPTEGDEARTKLRAIIAKLEGK